MEIIKKCHYQYFWEIRRQITIVIWWLILYSPTKLWDVMSLEAHLT